MNLAKNTTSKRSRFKVVCESCGSLSIKVADHPANSPDTAVVQCGRCSIARGTLADLHVLARSGNDVFRILVPGDCNDSRSKCGSVGKTPNGYGVDNSRGSE
jgi:hypothetical protein